MWVKVKSSQVKVVFIASPIQNKIFDKQAWFKYNKYKLKKKRSVLNLGKLSIYHNIVEKYTSEEMHNEIYTCLSH